jgi:hypothetical protein
MIGAVAGRAGGMAEGAEGFTLRQYGALYCSDIFLFCCNQLQIYSCVTVELSGGLMHVASWASKISLANVFFRLLRSRKYIRFSVVASCHIALFLGTFSILL